MARGKHGKAAAARREAAELADLEAVMDALEVELAALEDARAQVAALELDEQTLAREVSRRDRRAAGELERVRAEIEALAVAVEAAAGAERVVGKAHAALTDRVVVLLGGGSVGMEALLRLYGAPGDTTVTFSKNVTAPLAAQRLQMARGMRSSLSTPQDSQPRWLLDVPGFSEHPFMAGYEGLLDDRRHPREGLDEEQVAALAELDAAASRALTRSWETGDLLGWSMWHPLGTVAPVEEAPGRVGRRLGCPEVLDPFTQARPLPRRGPVPAPGEDWSAARRDSLALADPSAVVAGWRDWLRARAKVLAQAHVTVVPWEPAPDYASPVDALGVQVRYVRSAAGRWISAGYRDGAAGEMAAWGQMTCGLAGAAPFWLPPGHAAAYLESQPLTVEDRDELRLPYPQVLVTFADPVLIPSEGGVLDPDRAAVLAGQDEWVLNLAERSDPDVQTCWRARPVELGAARPTLDEVVADRGALVEGVLLLGDGQGRMRSRFGWLVACPSADGGVLSRMVVPADLDGCELADMVWNLAAVAAWGDWHAAAEGRDGAAGSGEWLRAGGPGGVRVLDVSTTESRGREDEEGQGRAVATHMRRGHWRRQRYGPGRSRVRRVRIAPVLVNAGRTEMAPRVYRVPVLPG